MRITAITAQKNRPDRVDVVVDGGQRLTLAQEVVFRAGLRPGDSLDEALLRGLLEEDQLWSAREASLNLLSYRARTAAELRRRLRQKGFADEVVERCVGDLLASRLVDDAGFAETFARDRVRLRPRGPRRLVQELRARGVDADTAADAVGQAMETQEVSELDLARDAAGRWAPRPGEDRQHARGRLYAFLARRGFSADTVRELMEEVDER